MPTGARAQSDELKRLLQELKAERQMRLETEKALRQVQERYRQLFNHAPAGIYDADFRTGKFTFVNDVVCDYTGYRRDELLNMSLLQLLTEESQKLFLQRLAKLFAGENVPNTAEFKIRHKSGREFWIQLTARYIYEERQLIGATVVVHDINERKLAEQALKASEEKYRTIIENIQEGYFEVDLAGNMTFFNEPVCRILGYSRKELMGMNNRQYTTADSARKMYQTFNEVYRSGLPSTITDYELVRKDGGTLVMELSTYLMTDSGTGRPIGFRGFVRNISDRLKAEEEKRKLERKLQVVQKLESIATLAGGVAHDFNNLMMSILGNISLMQIDTPPSHPHYEKLKNIEKQIQSGAKLTHQLLGYARKGKYAVKPMDLNQIVRETAEAFGRTRKQITIHLDLLDPLAPVEADQTQIEQVLLNLYVNAADAMPGGGQLFIRTALLSHGDLKGKSYSPKPGRYVLLEVKDLGIGMDKKTMERIFDPFFTTKEMGRGTGLGLASAYGIIKAHNGYIDVDSMPGRGTVFWIYLPATDKKIEKKALLNETLKIGHGTVLIVDDEESVLDISTQMLERSGYTVIKAGGGREALHIFADQCNAIDLVILDMVMPDVGGGQAYDEMKRIHPQVKVLLSSGYSLDRQAKQIMAKGCNGFIQKPFSMGQLTGRIEEILNFKP